MTTLSCHDFGVADSHTSSVVPHPDKHDKPERRERPPADPDPKSHPLHRGMPLGPILEGTDPKQPVRERGHERG